VVDALSRKFEDVTEKEKQLGVVLKWKGIQLYKGLEKSWRLMQIHTPFYLGAWMTTLLRKASPISYFLLDSKVDS